MTIWAIADLHLSFGTPGKEMSLFGSSWHDHEKRIEAHWKECIKDDDLVLIAGDISWALKLEEAIPDLEWIHQLPGTKVLIRGNHDYWWTSLKKMQNACPPSIHFIQNNCFIWQEHTTEGARLWAICGARLWDYTFSFGSFVDFQSNPKENKKEKKEDPGEREKIYARELQRLELSLQSIPSHIEKRIAMVHYPPVDATLHPSPTSDLLEKYGIQTCLFGHLHSLRANSLPFGQARGVRYLLTACDYLNFAPIRIT